MMKILRELPRPILIMFMMLLAVLSGIILAALACTTGLVRNPLEVPGLPLKAVTISPGSSGRVLTLEVDPQLTKDGIRIGEKNRDANRIVIQIVSTQKDLDSTNYSYILFDINDEKLSSSNFSIPRLKKDEFFEWAIEDDAIPVARRLVIRYFGGAR